MDTIKQPQSTIQFPPTTRPEGATPAQFGRVDAYGPLHPPRYFAQAEGPIEVKAWDCHALCFPHHTAGQIAALLDGQALHVDTIEIRGGELDTKDIDAIASAGTDNLVLGHERDEEGFCETTVSFRHGADLSKLCLSYLTVSGIPFTDELLSTLGAPTELSLLAVDTTKVSLAAIARLRWLEILWMAGVAVDPLALRSLESLRSLWSIRLQHTDLTDDELPLLSSLPSLTHLEIGYNKNIGWNLKPLTHARQLTWISLATTGVTDKSLAPLGRMPWLRHVVLQCTAVTDKGLSAIRDLPLQSLNLAGTALTDDGLAKLVRDLPTLESLDLRATRVTRRGVAKLIPELPNLLELGVSGDLLDRDMGLHLSEHSSVRQLRICPPMDGRGWVEAVACLGAATWTGLPA
ncbi:MAG: hypothetical protein R2823_10530 [Acidimicrobiia bacterium]